MPEKKDEMPTEKQKPAKITQTPPNPKQCGKPMGKMDTSKTTPTSG